MSNWKSGERIVCIDNFFFTNILEKNKIYIIKNFHQILNCVDIYNYNGLSCSRFILLKELRKMKLNKIKNERL